MQSGPPNIVAIAVSVILIGVVLAFRLRSMSAKRPLRPATLWLMPAVFLGISILTLVEQPLHGSEWLWAALALVLGVAAGWQRGRLMKIWVDPESGQTMSQGSGWAIAFLVVLIVLRSLLRTGLQYEAGSWAISPALINNAFVLFALGLFGTQRAEMAIRASRLRKAFAQGETGVI